MAAPQIAHMDETAANNDAPHSVSNRNVDLDAAPHSAPEPEPTPMLIGAFLSTIRQAKGYSLQDVHLATKVKTIHLEAIEKGDRAALPTTAFAAGFVKAYAKFLALDPEESAAQFRAELVASDTPAAATARPEPAPVKQAIARPIITTNEPATAAPEKETPAKAPADRFTLMAGAAAAGICALIIAGAILTKKPVGAPDASADIVAALAAPAGVITPKPQRVFAEMADLYDEGGAPQDAAAGAETITPSRSEAKKMVATPTAKSPHSQPELTPVAPMPLAAITPRGTPDEPVPQAPSKPAQLQAEPAAGIAAPIPSDETPALPAQMAPQGARPAPVIVEASLVNAPVAKFPRNCAAARGAIINVGVVFDIAANGRPANAKIISSDNGCFDSAALAAAGTMKFSPRTIDGKPAVEGAKRVTIRFQG